MGSHDRKGKLGENADQTLKKKYGKWKALVASTPSLLTSNTSQLASNPSLEAQLLRAGGKALDDLGYTSPPPQVR